MINFMHQTGECRWNQPLVTDQPMILKLGTCTFPSLSQQSNSSLRQISLKNTHSHHRLPTHQHRQDYQINPTTPDPQHQSNLIRFSAVDYVYLCITREGERRTERGSSIPTEAKKNTNISTVVDSLSRRKSTPKREVMKYSKKEKSLLVSLIKTSFFGLR